jgi:Fic family protein
MYLHEPPSLNALAEKLDEDQLLGAYEAPAMVLDRGRYLHWDEIRRRSPPAGLSREQWWFKTKLARIDEYRRLPLLTSFGEPFVYAVPDLMLRRLHQIDRGIAGSVAMGAAVTSDADSQRRYLVNSLEEEAIRSSQLEGAMTSRVAAKELLRSGRAPRDHGERMIANNYRALQFVREGMGDELTPEKVLELHRIVAAGVIEPADAAGRLQHPDEERVKVYDRDGGDPVHVPPPAAELRERLAALCEFANEASDGEGGSPFVHPALRAILLHFQLAYDHPFADGNGRTARLLFFWKMRQSGYWLADYLPISRLLRRARSRYVRAFVETETDGGDTTYFLIHQLETIERAVADLDEYLRRKAGEQRDGQRLLDAVGDLNGRQAVLLTHALKHPDHRYTFGGHARGNRVTHETARSDLGGLAERGLLVRRRQGRSYVFEPAPNLLARLKESAA